MILLLRKLYQKLFVDERCMAEILVEQCKIFVGKLYMMCSLLYNTSKYENNK